MRFRNGMGKEKWLRWFGMVAVLFIVLLLAWRQFQAHREKPSRVMRVASSATQSAMGVAAGPAKLTITRRNQPASSEPPAVLTPLPRRNTPVVEVLSQLREAANKGDSRAACRIGLELTKCFRQQALFRDLEGQAKTTLADVGKAEAAPRLQKHIQDVRQNMAQEIARCDGVAATDVNEAWSYLLQAAKAGYVDAAIDFANFPPNSASPENAEVLDIWMEDRETFRQMGIQAGDTSSLLVGMFESTFGVGQPGESRRFPQDPYAAIKYATALSSLWPEQVNGVISQQIALNAAKLPPDRVAAAKVDGQQLQQQYFAGAVMNDDAHTQAQKREGDCMSRNP